MVFQGWESPNSGGNATVHQVGQYTVEEGLHVGSWTMNEVRRGAAINLLLLLAMAGKDCYFDPFHRRMYFVRRCVHKPDVIRAMWRWAVFKVNCVQTVKRASVLGAGALLGGGASGGRQDVVV